MIHSSEAGDRLWKRGSNCGQYFSHVQHADVQAQVLIVNCRTRIFALKRELQKSLLRDLSSCKEVRRSSSASHEPLATRLTAMLLGLSEKTVAQVWTRLGKVDPAPPRRRSTAIAQPPAERLSAPPEGCEQMLCRHGMMQLTCMQYADVLSS